MDPVLGTGDSEAAGQGVAGESLTVGFCRVIGAWEHEVDGVGADAGCLFGLAVRSHPKTGLKGVHSALQSRKGFADANPSPTTLSGIGVPGQAGSHREGYKWRHLRGRCSPGPGYRFR